MNDTNCTAPGEHKLTKNGHCRRCAAIRFNTDPAIKAKRVAGIRAKFKDPEKRARHNAMATANVQRWQQTAEGQERLRRIGEALHIHSRREDAMEKWRAGRKAAGAKRSERVLAWCPPEKRAEYIYMVRTKRLTAAEARDIIEAEIKRNDPIAVARRQIAAFDQQQRERAARERRDAY